MADLGLIESVAIQRCSEIRKEEQGITADYKVKEDRAIITIRKNGSINGYEFVESVESMAPHGVRYPAYIEHLKNQNHVGIIVPQSYLTVMKIEVSSIHHAAGARPVIMSYAPTGEIRKA